MQTLYNVLEPHRWEATAVIGYQLMDLNYSRGEESCHTFFFRSLSIYLQTLGMILCQPFIAFAKVLSSVVSLDLKDAIENFYQGVKNEVFFIISAVILPAILFYNRLEQEEADYIQRIQGVDDAIARNKKLIESLEKEKAERPPRMSKEKFSRRIELLGNYIVDLKNQATVLREENTWLRARNMELEDQGVVPDE